MEGLHDQAYHFWSHGVQRWLQLQSTALNIEDDICVSTVIDNAKALHRQAFHQADHSVGRYRQMLQVQHQDYELASCLSTVKIFKNRRVVSKFRCGCHGLHVDTGEFKPVGQKVDREQRFCFVCASDTTEDEHHFVFDCPAYCSIRDGYTAIFWGPAQGTPVDLTVTPASPSQAAASSAFTASGLAATPLPRPSASLAAPLQVSPSSVLRSTARFQGRLA